MTDKAAESVSLRFEHHPLVQLGGQVLPLPVVANDQPHLRPSE
jgi:hypothetical protein